MIDDDDDEPDLFKRIFDKEESEKLKQEGMERAAMNGKALLEVARKVALEITPVGWPCHADMVGRALKDRGLPHNLGPAAGSMFKTDDWEMIPNATVKSQRRTNHSRKLEQWRRVR
jgi:hypothetical protein